MAETSNAGSIPGAVDEPELGGGVQPERTGEWQARKIESETAFHRRLIRPLAGGDQRIVSDFEELFWRENPDRDREILLDLVRMGAISETAITGGEWVVNDAIRDRLLFASVSVYMSLWDELPAPGEFFNPYFLGQSSEISYSERI